MTHFTSAVARLARHVARLASGFALLSLLVTSSGCSATQSVVDKVVGFHNDCLESGDDGRERANEVLFGPAIPERTSSVAD